MNEMRDVNCNDLANIEGGWYWHSDGYCGTPYPWPPRPCTENLRPFEKLGPDHGLASQRGIIAILIGL
jgi:hypothetical protein